MANIVFIFFVRILNTDKSLVTQITESQSSLYFEQGQLLFTLKGLFQFMTQELVFEAFILEALMEKGIMNESIDDFRLQQSVLHSASYPAFRKALYNSTINQDLQRYKAKVDIFSPAKNLDSTVYCLKFR